MKVIYIPVIITIITLLLISCASAKQSADQCNIYTDNNCFKIDWMTATPDEVKFVDLNEKDVNGRTALHWAASRNSDPKVIETLLNSGSDIHAEDYMGYTPLHTAVEGPKSFAAVIKVLFAAGAKVNAKSKDGAGTPLHIAAIRNEPWVLKTLLDAGADPNAGDFDNMTPLHTAAFGNKDPKVLLTLLKAGANPNHAGKKGNRAQQAGYTPLHAAAKGTKNPQIVYALIQAGAHLETPNKDGYTPFHVACDANRTPEVLTAFLKSGANINATNPGGNTPMHAVAYANYPEMVETLVKAGAKVNAINNDGMTPLHLAAIGNPDPAVVMEFITSGALPNVRDKAGKTPFDYAKKNQLMKETDGDGYRMLQFYNSIE